MLDLDLRGPLLQIRRRDRNPTPLPGLSIISRDHKEAIVIFAAVRRTGPVLVPKRCLLRAPLLSEYSAPTTSKEAGAPPWQPDEALHRHLGEEAEAVSRKLEDEEDVGLAMEEWPACMP